MELQYNLIFNHIIYVKFYYYSLLKEINCHFKPYTGTKKL